MAKMYLDSGGAATNSGTSDNNAADLSGSANATIAANKTFVDADVNTGTDVITVTAHGYLSGTGVELTSIGTLPAGLTLTTLYYLCAVSVDTLTLHTNVADALAGTNPVNITAAAGGGTHTINNYTIALGGAPDLSAVNGHHVRVTTTGTSHVITTAGGPHGLTTGDAVFHAVWTGGTMPTNLGDRTVRYVNVLSSTTYRCYSTLALALAGGASDINVSAAEVRTLNVFTEVAAAVNLASSSVSNRKIFWIRAVDDTNKLLIVDQVVTGLGAGSDWAIGGRVNASGAVDLFNSVRGGDEVIFNTDISGALNLSMRIVGNTGPGNFTPGPVPYKITGKSGARRVLTNTGNGTLFAPAGGGSHHPYGYFSNMELQSQGTGSMIGGPSNWGGFFYDCVLSDGGATMGITSNTFIFVRSSLSGSPGFTHNSGSFTFIQSHFRDITGDLLPISGISVFCIGCIFERIGDNIIQVTPPGGTPENSRNTMLMLGNTLYMADNSAYEEIISSTLISQNMPIFLDNIFKDNGNASTEANIEIAAPDRRIFLEKNNLFNISGGRGGVNALGFTLDASDITGDPLFVDPDASAGSRNFGLQSGSPAKGIQYTYPGSLSVSYRDLGAVQAAGGAPSHGNMTGGMQ